MKKQVLKRGMLGFPQGIAIGYVITIAVSFASGGRNYLPCAPGLIDAAGSEIRAVILQAVLCGILGASFGGCSVIWEIENWSIFRQTYTYFLITALVMMPVAYYLRWMLHSFAGFLFYLGTYTAIFFVIWVVQYLIWKRRIKQMNAKIEEAESDSR